MKRIIEMKKASKTQKLVFAAIMAGIGYVISMLYFPFPLAPYLRIEVSEIVVILTTLILGWKYGVATAVVRGILHFLLDFSAGPIIGEIVFTTSSILVALITHVFYFKVFKAKKWALVLTLIVVSIIYTIGMCLVNFYVVLPIYYGQPFSKLSQDPQYLNSIIVIFLPFNILKMSLVSIATYLVGLKIFSQKNKNLE